MTRYVAFLRGINLGNRRLRMDELRACFEAVGGLARVETFIASGNVVFDAGSTDARALEATIEAHLGETLGYDVDTFIRPLSELATIAALGLLPEAGDEPGWKAHVLFLKETARDGAEARLGELATEDDRFRVSGRQIYWLRRGGLSDSTLAPGDVERAAGGETGTLRTMNTVRRIVAKFSDGDG